MQITVRAPRRWAAPAAGLSTKVHLVADRRCRPIARMTSPGQHGDSPKFIPLLRAIRIARRRLGHPRTRPGAVMAGKAYSSKANRAHLRTRGIAAVIPVKADQAANRREKGSRGGRPRPSTLSATRNATPSSGASTKLRQHRAVATRYDKRDRIYQGTIDVASIKIWLRDPVT